MTASFDFGRAARAVAGLTRRTPLLPATELGDRLGVPVWLKCECLQVTGSFKVRGAASRLSALTDAERRAGVVACSSGNHGRAVAHVARELGVPATVCVPEWVDPVKLAGIRDAGAETLLIGETFDEAEAHAVELASASGRPYVSAYDDPWVIAGQGTIAWETLDQLGEAPGTLLAPLSGGGLIGGMSAAFGERLGEGAPRTVAVSAENAAVMLASLNAGRPVEVPEEETLANALAGGIGRDNRYSFELVRDRIHEHVTVTESEIVEAMRYAVRHVRLVVEGGGAVALAALLAGSWAPVESSGPIVVVLSGGNVAPDVLAGVLTPNERGPDRTAGPS